MYRTIMFAGWLLALITTSISQPFALGLEGIVVEWEAAGRSAPGHAAKLGDPLEARLTAEPQSERARVRRNPGRWDCDTPESEVHIRRVTLCRAKAAGGVPVPADRDGVIRYRVLVEKGLHGLGATFAERVEKILGLESGWAGHELQFVRSDDKYDFAVVLAQPASVDRLCRPLTTRGELSCAMARNAVINARRWHEGANTWGGNIRGYHHYLINHEVGHVLGLRHLRCEAEGMPAPIMLQQTIDLKGCVANGSVTSVDLASLSRIMPRIRRRFDSLAVRDDRQVTKPRVRRRARIRRWKRNRRLRRARALKRRKRSSRWKHLAIRGYCGGGDRC